MSEAVYIICFLIFFVIILWIYNYSKRKREIKHREQFWGKIGNFFKKTVNKVINWSPVRAVISWGPVSYLIDQAARLLKLKREQEEREQRDKLVREYRAKLLDNFNIVDTIPPHILSFLVAEIADANRRRQAYLDKLELDRKRSAYKVINELQRLADNLPNGDSISSMIRILNGDDSTYPVKDIKGNNIANTKTINAMLEILRKNKISPDDIQELNVMGDTLREYNCNGEQWCFANTSQWKYKRKD